VIKDEIRLRDEDEQNDDLFGRNGSDLKKMN
jgi:hypothetical protein